MSMTKTIKSSQANFLVARRIPIMPERKTFSNADNIDDVRQYLLRNHQDLFQSSLFEQTGREKAKRLIHDYLIRCGYTGAILEEKVTAYTDEICGLGPIDRLFAEPDITDIMVNRYDDIWIMRAGRRQEEKVPLSFENEEHVRRIATKIANASGQQLSLTNPMPICYLPGARVNIVIPPISQTGTTITIRKYSNRLFSFDEMIKQGLLTEEALDYLKWAMEEQLNIVLAGPVRAGKTSLLRNLVQFIPDTERIVVFEAIPELQLKLYYPQKHIISYTTRETFNKESQMDLEMLFERSLSQNMRRFIFGEIRGKETMTVMEALNTGHKGLVTVHGSSAEDAVERMIMMCLRTDRDISPEYTGKMIARTLDVVVHMNDLKIMEIAEVLDYVDGRPVLRMVFERKNGQLVRAEDRKVMVPKPAASELQPTGTNPSQWTRFPFDIRI